MKYIIPNSEQKITFLPSVIETFKLFCQDAKSFESGGLLFAEFFFPDIVIKLATKPTKNDKCSRFSFTPDRKLQRNYIRKNFKLGLHFVGEWHTHPTQEPMPSNLDIHSMTDSFTKSKHSLNFFIMVIVGSNKEKLHLWCSLHNSKGMIELYEEK